MDNNRSGLPVIILDRDGVINADSLEYIKSPDEFCFLPGSIAAIARLSRAGFQIGVATNQSVISRGYASEETVAAIHTKMLTHIRKAGGMIQHVVYCPHMPDSGCLCRKPAPGMLHELARRFHCRLNQMLFIGDRVTDLRAAEAAGVKSILIYSSMTNRQELEAYQSVPRYESLSQCADSLMFRYLEEEVVV